MRRCLVVVIILNIYFINCAVGKDALYVDIKVKEIRENEIICDFVYSFNIQKERDINFYISFLPFNNNSSLTTTIINNNPRLFFTTGFKNNGNGIVLFNSTNKSENFRVEFHEVSIPCAKVNQGLIVNLNLISAERPFPFETTLSKYLYLDSLVIETPFLVDSSPKFEQANKGAGFYKMKLTQQEEGVSFVLPFSSNKSYGIIIILFLMSVFGGVFGSLFVLHTKFHYTLGAIVSMVLILLVAYLFYIKVIPIDFDNDFDMLSIIGGFIGLSLGVLLTSIFNLHRFHVINTQQSSSIP